MIEIENDGKGHLAVNSPYHPDFPPAAKNAGGRWDGAKWQFNARDRDIVDTLLRDTYGYAPPEYDEPTVTITITVEEEWSAEHGPLMIAGMILASARGRDSGARVGPGVVLKSQHHRSIGSRGSLSRWKTYANPGATFIARDIPLSQAEAMLANKPSEISVTYTQPEQTSDEVPTPRIYAVPIEATTHDEAGEPCWLIADSPQGALDAANNGTKPAGWIVRLADGRAMAAGETAKTAIALAMTNGHAIGTIAAHPASADELDALLPTLPPSAMGIAEGAPSPWWRREPRKNAES